MIAADSPIQRPPSTALGSQSEWEMFHSRRAAFVDFLRPGDVVIANDAATLPASLQGNTHRAAFPSRSGWLAGTQQLGADDVLRFSTVTSLGAGDYRTLLENREPPPRIALTIRTRFQTLSATVEQLDTPNSGDKVRRSADNGPESVDRQAHARRSIVIKCAHR